MLTNKQVAVGDDHVNSRTVLLKVAIFLRYRLGRGMLQKHGRSQKWAPEFHFILQYFAVAMPGK